MVASNALEETAAPSHTEELSKVGDEYAPAMRTVGPTTIEEQHRVAGSTARALVFLAPQGAGMPASKETGKPLGSLSRGGSRSADDEAPAAEEAATQGAPPG